VVVGCHNAAHFGQNGELEKSIQCHVYSVEAHIIRRIQGDSEDAEDAAEEAPTLIGKEDREAAVGSFLDQHHHQEK